LLFIRIASITERFFVQGSGNSLTGFVRPIAFGSPRLMARLGVL
jgi:hypothetical protein